MRQLGIVVALLVAAIHLPACAVGGSTREQRGQSGPVSWEMVDTRQELQENGSRILDLWTFTLVFKNTGDTGIAFDRVDIGSQAAGSVDSIHGGMGTAPFARRLEPGAEIRVRESSSWGCPQGAPAHLHRVLSDGIIAYYTLFGRDDKGNTVRVPVAVRLNSSVGERQ